MLYYRGSRSDRLEIQGEEKSSGKKQPVAKSPGLSDPGSREEKKEPRRHAAKSQRVSDGLDVIVEAGKWKSGQKLQGRVDGETLNDQSRVAAPGIGLSVTDD